MLNMSKASTAPIQPVVSKADESHPLFNKYMIYRSAMINQGVTASAFSDYVRSMNEDVRDNAIRATPEYKTFQAWMVANKGGLRAPCLFPENFYRWCNGERW